MRASPPTKEELDEDAQVDFKGKAKAFVRTYSFLASVLPYTDASWEKLSTFLTFLVPKLPAPKEDDLSQAASSKPSTWTATGSRNARPRKFSSPTPTPRLIRFRSAAAGSGRSLNWNGYPTSSRCSTSNSGTSNGKTATGSANSSPKKYLNELPLNSAYRNAKQNSDKQNAKIEHDKALARVIVGLMKDDTELFKQYQDNPGFNRWLADTVFSMTYEQPRP